MITGPQILAARTLLRISARRLADMTGLHSMLLIRAESAKEQVLTEAQATVLQHILEAAGVEFTNGGQPGVRLKARQD